MPCVFLLFETQHSRLLEGAQELVHAAASAADDWPDRLYAFRRALMHHDRMEREVLRELGAPTAPDELCAAFDLALSARKRLVPDAVTAAARGMARVIEDHAVAQETGLFPALAERHPLALRHQFGGRYFDKGESRWLTQGQPPAAA